MASPMDFFKALLGSRATSEQGPAATPTYYNAPLDPMRNVPQGDILAGINASIQNQVATPPPKPQPYPLSPADPMGTAMDIVDPSGTMRGSPLGFLATIPQPSRVPMRDDSQMAPPMGMAESLRQRSGDDIPKPEAAKEAPKAPGKSGAKKEAAPKVDNSDLQPARLNDLLNTPDVGEFTEEDLDNAVAADQVEEDPLRAAQKRADMLGALLMMGKGAEKVGTSIAGVQSDKDYLDSMKPLIGKGVEDVLTQQRYNETKADRELKNAAEQRALAAEGRAGTAEQRAAQGFDLEQQMKQFNFANLKESEDPASPASEFARQSLANAANQVGLKLKIPDKLSAAELQRQLPYFSNMITAKMAQDARLEAARLKNEDRKDKEKDKKLEIDSKKTERFRNSLNNATKTQQNIFDQRNQMIQDVEEFIANPNASKGFRDIALTYGFIKGRDDSAVREGEIALLGNAGSIPDRARRAMNRALKGETYNVADMRALADVLATENKSLKKAYQSRAKNVLGQAKKEGLDVNDIIRTDMMDMDEPTNQPQGNNNQMVTVREKATGRMKKVSAADAQKILADSRFEQVK